MSVVEDTAKAAAYWDEQIRVLQSQPNSRVRWWDDQTTVQHINGLLGHPELLTLHGAFHLRIARHFEGRTRLKAISVGCARATKEMSLMQMTDIVHFDLFDISPGNVELGRQEAVRLGFGDRVNFRVADAFVTARDTDYDLVYWNNALHHMPDVEAAIKWSHDRLKPGGLFAMDDYVGPDRFQWTDENVKWANLVRAAMSERLLGNPYASGSLLSREIFRPTVESMIAVDPSEAMDSARTISAIHNNFPVVEIIPTGGALYNLALSDAISNFTTADDMVCLRQILLLDQLLAVQGTTQYAVAFAIR